ncbi:unnamed protein product, partial [marine sediment metagenome]
HLAPANIKKDVNIFGKVGTYEGVPTPSGLIVMWHGTIATIPAGYVICDGNNSTPNLLTRFIEGVATAATNPGATGGATAKTTAGHQHDIPLGIYSDVLCTDWDEWGTSSTFSCKQLQTDDARDVEETGASRDRNAGKARSNTDSISDIRPKYYDIAFLMKT